MSQSIEQLHRAYCQETRLDVACTLFRHFTWEAFIARGFTVSDVQLVCRHLRKQVNQNRRTIGAMSFHKLIGDLEYFEEHLAECRSIQRKPRFSKGKEEILKATQRPSEPVQPPGKKAEEVLKNLNIAAKLREFKDTL